MTVKFNLARFYDVIIRNSVFKLKCHICWWHKFIKPNGLKFPTKFPELFIDDIKKLSETEIVTKFLGVFIYENVTWKDHIITISTMISKRIGILYGARVIISRKQFNELYFLSVLIYLNHVNLAWGSTQKMKLSTLYRQQKNSIRLLSLKDQFTHSRPLF